MKEQIITYKTASLAKEKGFNEEVQHRYNENKELLPTKLGMHGKPNNYQDSIAAPTQALLQRWLREEKGLCVEMRVPSSIFRGVWHGCIYKYDDMYKEWKFIDLDKVYPDAPLSDRIFLQSKSYSEALEMSLQEALKLI